MAKIIIPTPLRKFTKNNASFDATGNTVREAILNLIETHDSLGTHLLDKNGNIRSFVRIYVGDEDIQALEKDATSVKEDSVISIVPAIAGGC